MIFKNFTGVFLSKPHLHLKNSAESHKYCNLEKELLPLDQPWQLVSHCEVLQAPRDQMRDQFHFCSNLVAAGPSSPWQWEVTHGACPDVAPAQGQQGRGNEVLVLLSTQRQS